MVVYIKIPTVRNREWSGKQYYLSSSSGGGGGRGLYRSKLLFVCVGECATEVRVKERNGNDDKKKV